MVAMGGLREAEPVLAMGGLREKRRERWFTGGPSKASAHRWGKARVKGRM